MSGVRFNRLQVKVGKQLHLQEAQILLIVVAQVQPMHQEGLIFLIVATLVQPMQEIGIPIVSMEGTTGILIHVVVQPHLKDFIMVKPQEAQSQSFTGLTSDYCKRKKSRYSLEDTRMAIEE